MAGTKYWMSEITAPKGTKLNKEVKSFTPVADKTSNIEFANSPDSGRIIIHKRDKKVPTQGVQAKFTLYMWSEEDGKYVSPSYLDASIPEDYYTDVAGNGETGELYYTEDNKGKWRLKETDVYETNGKKYEVDKKAVLNYTIGRDASPLTWTVYNEEIPPNPGYIEVQKTMEHLNDHDLTATFTVYDNADCTGIPATIITTNANGYGKSAKLPSVQDYWVKETDWNYGMEPKLDANGKVLVEKVEASEIEDGKIKRIAHTVSEGAKVGVQDEWYAGLSVKKIDEVTGKPLAGAEYTFYEWNGSTYVELVKRKSVYVDENNNEVANVNPDKMTKNENGEWTFNGKAITAKAIVRVNEKLARYTNANQGKFAVRGTKAPDGYSLKDTSMHYAVLTLFNKGKILDFDDYVYSNPPLGYLDITKIIIDSTNTKITSEDLSSDALGITYGLYFDEQCTNQVPGYGRIVLNKDGHYKTEGLVPATYWLRENTLNESIFSNKSKAKVKVEIQAGKTTYLDGEHGLWRDEGNLMEDGSRDWDNSIWKD